MRRGVFDVLRRGLDDTLVNWPLIAIRLGETLLFAVITIVAVIAALLPILVSIGIHLTQIESPEDAFDAMLLLSQQWMLLVWIVVVVSFLVLVFVAIHAFVQAGCARVYVDAEKIAGPEVEAPRSRFQLFSVDRFMAGGAGGWWVVFWIYNLAWSLAGLILLVPLVPTMLLMVVFREQPAVMAATGCLGIVVTLLLLIVVGLVTGMWTNRAIATWAVRQADARESLSTAWRALSADLGRHLLIAVAMIVVGMAGSMFFASFGFFAAFGETLGNHHGMFSLMTFPLRIAGSVFSSAFSAAVSSWYLASYSALATER